jgi:enoyl-CoA hydratase/carnithine racemase
VELDDLKVTRYVVADSIATITLDRPERLNAWTGRMNTEYRSLLERARADGGVRVIVVTGAGRGFCAGADTRALEGHVERGGYDPGTGPGLATPGYGVRPEFDAEFAYHFGIPKPIIAAVNGPAAGVGFALACYCDLRFAAAGAKLTTAHGRLGLPAEFGLSWLLPRLVGLTRAADVLLSSRVLLAEEAAEIGLVNKVTPPGELSGAVLAYARMLATEVSPASLAATKLQLYTDLHRDAATAARQAEVSLRAMMSGPDFVEGVAALTDHRPPHFADLSEGTGLADGADLLEGPDHSGHPDAAG